MTIEVYTRHSVDCPQKDNRYYRRCRCRKWLIFVDQNKRVSAGTRSWEEAERKARTLSDSTVAVATDTHTVRQTVKAFSQTKSSRQSLTTGSAN